MTKKKILADENQEIFQEKFKLLKFSSESEIFSKIGKNLKQGENALWSQGGWTPLDLGLLHFIIIHREIPHSESKYYSSLISYVFSNYNYY